MHVSKLGAAAIAAIILTAGGAATLLAQATDTGAGAGSLAALTSEIRHLRVAIEQSTRTQTQAQVLGIFLSAQQSRILQLTTRLDAARKEVDATTQRSTDHAARLATLEKALERITDPNERTAVEDQSTGLKLAIKAISAEEQQARVREAEMLQAWQQEEARWNDLIARLQEIVQR